MANGVGYGVILLMLGFVRELFGSGSLWGVRIVPEAWYIQNGGWYANNGLMMLPPMALILVGVIIWVHRGTNKDLIEK